MRLRSGVVLLPLLLAGCGQRLSPPPPAPDFSAGQGEAAVTPEREPGRTVPASVDRPREAARAEADVGPFDAIVGSSFSSHEGIEERVQWWVEYWQSRGRGSFERYLIRMGRYVDFVDQELAARGMPPSLRYLPVVEAGYYPPAISPVGAGGLWQFMPPTATWLGLGVTTLVDERMDPYAATPVALEYLRSLNDQFGSWFLTLAAYNSGPGRVERIIQRYAADEPRNDALFWKLRDRLPAETRDFVPKFLAAARMGGAPGDFGFGSVEPDPPQAFDDVQVAGATSIDVLAELAGLDVESMEELNPHLLRGLTPAGTETLVRVPQGRGSDFVARLAQLPQASRVTFAEHRVGPGETLSHVALMYGVSVAELQGANPSVSPRRMGVGTRLTIPKRGAAQPVLLTSTVGAGESSGGGGIPGRLHVVSRGESLWTIALSYDVSVDQIREWNRHLGDSEGTIHPGDELRVQEPGSTTYRVQVGDTLWEIAAAHRISVDELVEYNGMSPRGLIRPGDQVQIPPAR
ncbi:MAG: LysM peptidoglycan-binding domain-containing protein [Longimicrobiales bacterium]